MDAHEQFGDALDDGDAVVGARSTCIDPLFVEVYADLGFDFVWVDFEHTDASALDSRPLERLVRAADAAGTSLLARLPSAEPHAVRKVLDTGVRNVLVPRVRTAEEVRRAVEATRFVYDDGPGERGAAAGRANRWGNGPDDYAAREDASTCLGVMVENAEAVANLAEICSVPHLGFVFVGPSDLSVSLGHPLETDHPEVEAAVERVRATCLDAGVPVGRIANDAATARAAIEDGYQVLRVGDEVSAAAAVLGDRLERIRGGD